MHLQTDTYVQPERAEKISIANSIRRGRSQEENFLGRDERLHNTPGQYLENLPDRKRKSRSIERSNCFNKTGRIRRNNRIQGVKTKAC